MSSHTKWTYSYFKNNKLFHFYRTLTELICIWNGIWCAFFFLLFIRCRYGSQTAFDCFQLRLKLVLWHRHANLASLIRTLFGWNDQKLDYSSCSHLMTGQNFFPVNRWIFNILGKPYHHLEQFVILSHKVDTDQYFPKTSHVMSYYDIFGK